MKNLIKSALLILMMVLVTPLEAQQVSIKGGLNLARMHPTGGQEIGRQSLRPGFHLGVITDWMISRDLALETGLLFSNRGFRSRLIEEHEEFGMDVLQTVTYSYLEVPLQLKRCFVVSRERCYSLRLGPYAAYGLFAKHKAEGILAGETYRTSDKLDWENVDRFDWGVGAGAGVAIGSLLMELGYDLSFRTAGMEDMLASSVKLSLAYQLFE